MSYMRTLCEMPLVDQSNSNLHSSDVTVTGDNATASKRAWVLVCLIGIAAMAFFVVVHSVVQSATLDTVQVTLGTPRPILVDVRCLSWQRPLIVAEPASEPLQIFSKPDVAVDAAGNAHAVWSGHYPPHTAYYARLEVSASRWSLPLGVDDPTEEPPRGYSDPSIAVDSQGMVHVVWADSRHGSPYAAVAYSRLRPGETIWSPHQIIGGDQGPVTNGSPAIAVDGQDVLHVVWEGAQRAPGDDTRFWYNIYYTASDDGGVGWRPAITVTDHLSATQRLPELAVAISGTVHVMWQDERDGLDIYYARLDPGTNARWSSNVKVFTHTGSYHLSPPSLAVDADGHVHAVAVAEDVNWEGHIYYALLKPGSSQWSVPIEIDRSWPYNWFSGPPMVVTDSRGSVHVTWAQGNHDVLYSCLPPGSSLWCFPSLISEWNINDRVAWPSLAITHEGDYAYVLWSNNRRILFSIGQPLKGLLFLPLVVRQGSED